MISIPENGLLATTGAQLGQLDVSKERKSCFFPHNECFLKFHEFGMKVLIYCLEKCDTWTDGRADKHT